MDVLLLILKQRLASDADETSRYTFNSTIENILKLFEKNGDQLLNYLSVNYLTTIPNK